ncbi:DUF2510 domain-containing protein [Nocardia vinacea]|uniref:DUF2510 domain-containing protein n=1 Tax=Nocardia vinacea TaxID=96468 RepID=UPI0009FC7664
MRKRFQPRLGPAARPYLPHGTPAALDCGTGWVSGSSCSSCSPDLADRTIPHHRCHRGYPDPANPGVVRWFDGRQWTPHT